MQPLKHSASVCYVQQLLADAYISTYIGTYISTHMGTCMDTHMGIYISTHIGTYISA